MSDIQIVKRDEGGVNARILARESKPDFRRVEAASLKMQARFTSAEGKRFFVRLFNTLQLNAHFISVIARTRVDPTEVGQAEAAIRGRIDAVMEQLNQAIDGAEALFKAHGISQPATYDTVALEVEVSVLSSNGRRFLEVLGKMDQLMPLLQTLEILEIITAQAVDVQRAAIKREVRNVANGARTLATALRRRMNAIAPRVPVSGHAEGLGALDENDNGETVVESRTARLGGPPAEGASVDPGTGELKEPLGGVMIVIPDRVVEKGSSEAMQDPSPLAREAP